MNIEDVKEWMEIADNDFDSAVLLNESVRKHYEIICYHCAQAAEKYIKGYLISKDIIPQKTHDLRFLNNLCIELDKGFENIITECAFLNELPRRRAAGYQIFLRKICRSIGNGLYCGVYYHLFYSLLFSTALKLPHESGFLGIKPHGE